MTLSDVSNEAFVDAKALLRDVIVQASPQTDVAVGSAIDGLILDPSAFLAAHHSDEYSRIRSMFNVRGVLDGSVSVSSSDLDIVMGGLGVTRASAASAQGVVQVVASADIPFAIATGFSFSAGALQFSTIEDVTVYPSGATVSGDGVQSLIRRTDGTYAFSLVVTATTPGDASNIPAGQALTIVSPLPGMVSAAAATQFTGGSDEESDQALLTKALTALTSQAVAGPMHIEALVRSVIPGATVAVAGVNSAVMLRSKRSIFGVSAGCMQDIYVRTTATVETDDVNVVGTVTSAATRSVSFYLTREQCVGLYAVGYIRNAAVFGVGGDIPTSVTRSLSVEPGEFIPSVKEQADLFATSIHTAHVVFVDSTSPSLTDGQEVTYTVTLYRMPLVDLATNTLTAHTVQLAGVDSVVKGAVPCVVSPTVSVKPDLSTVFDELALREAVAAEINALPFGTRQLVPYMVHRACSSVLGRGVVTSVRFDFTIFAPTGDTLVGSDTRVSLDGRLSAQVSEENTFFTTSVDRIYVRVEA